MGILDNHKHNLVVFDKEVLLSAFEQMTNISELEKAPLSFFRKKYILVLQCSVCGKLKEIVEVNPL